MFKVNWDSIGMMAFVGASLQTSISTLGLLNSQSFYRQAVPAEIASST